VKKVKFREKTRLSRAEITIYNEGKG
jgi:hypothetical protein